MSPLAPPGSCLLLPCEVLLRGRPHHPVALAGEDGEGVGRSGGVLAPTNRRSGSAWRGQGRGTPAVNPAPHPWPAAGAAPIAAQQEQVDGEQQSGLFNP